MSCLNNLLKLLEGVQGPGAGRQAEAAARTQAAGRCGRTAAGCPLWAGLQGAQVEPAVT